MGKGQHARFRVVQGSESASAVVFGRSERLAAKNGDTARLAGRLEINRWNGVEEPRFSIELGYSVGQSQITNLDPRDWETCVHDTLSQLQSTADQHGQLQESVPGERREALVQAGPGRSREGLLSELAARSNTVFVVGNLPRRSDWLAGRLGSVVAVEWSAISQGLVSPDFEATWAVLDPPSSSAALGLICAREGVESYRLWSDRELRFALKLHAAETEIEPFIRPFYAELRTAIRGQAEAPQIVTALQGSQAHVRSPQQVAAMIAVLIEIGAINMEDGLDSICLSEPTLKLEQSSVLAKLRDAGAQGTKFLKQLGEVD